jgi:hypothetical protein
LPATACGCAPRRRRDLAAGFNVDAPDFDAGPTASLDDAIELLRHNGYSLAHAVTRLVPPAWERDRDLPPDVRAFYEFQSLVSEPWDGPSALVFADGRYVGAALDRNGFRPSRIVSTADDLIAVASEVGVLPADEHEIVNRGRLGPGDMIVVDVERGSVNGDQRDPPPPRVPPALPSRLVADVRPLADPIGVDVIEIQFGWKPDTTGTATRHRRCRAGRRHSAARAKRSSCCSGR